MAEYLLAIEIFIITLGTRYLFTRDRLAGIYFLFLGIYAVPAQIGYLYLPELSELIQAYFGEEVWTPATLLIITSMATFLCAYKFARSKIFEAIPLRIQITPRKNQKLASNIALLLITTLITYEAAYLTLNFADISWQTAQDDDITGASFGYFLFIVIFKQTVGFFLVLYAVARQCTGPAPKSLIRILLAVTFLLFIISAAKLGNRTDILAITLGIIVYETSQTRINAKFLFRCAAALAAVAALLVGVEIGRTENAQESNGIAVALLTKDYYAPAHMLFAAISFDFVNPLEVIRSNTANALVKLNVPYLQATITDLFRPDLATRSAGYAFYVFAEGYMALGALGFIYNGLVLVIGITLWRKMASTNSREFNLFLLGLMGSMLVNVVRGQTSYFVKYLYTFLVPGMLLYCATMGMRLRFRFGIERTATKPPEGIL